MGKSPLVRNIPKNIKLDLAITSSWAHYFGNAQTLAYTKTFPKFFMAFAFEIAMATLQTFLSNNPYLYHSLLTHTLGTTLMIVLWRIEKTLLLPQHNDLSGALQTCEV
jgi:hypothetical protein